MKSSRAMLLAAILFAVPAFAEENTLTTETTASATTISTVDNNQPATDKVKEEAKTVENAAKEEAKTLMGKLATPFVFLAITAPDWIAENTLGKIAAIEYLKDGKIAAFLSNKYTGRVMVGTVAAYAAYKAYNAYNAQDANDVDTDEEIFG